MTNLNSKANISHTHDERYYTESEVNSIVSGYLKKDSSRIGSLSFSNYKFLTLPIDGRTYTIPFSGGSDTGVIVQMVVVMRNNARHLQVNWMQDGNVYSSFIKFDESF